MLVGFAEAACWALIVVANKGVIAYIHPLPLNFFLRLISIVFQLAITVPLTVLGWWDLGFGLTSTAAGYVAVSSVITWLIAFNAYYYALRIGRASVVAPISATDPVWAALFAPLVVGSALEPLAIVGLLVATTGVVLMARWMGEEPREILDAATAPVSVAPTDSIRWSGGPPRAVQVAILSLVAAAGWGLGPVVIELAENANRGPSVGMIVGSQSLGALMLGIAMAVRRGPTLVRPLTSEEQRRVVALLLVAGALEAAFSVLFYLIIDAIGAVLSVLIIATSPVFAILGGVILLKERFGGRLALGAAVTMAGVFIAILSHAG